MHTGERANLRPTHRSFVRAEQVDDGARRQQDAVRRVAPILRRANGFTAALALIRHVDFPQVGAYSRPPRRGGEIGRRAGFRCQWGKPRGGSSPLLGTNPSAIKRLDSRSASLVHIWYTYEAIGHGPRLSGGILPSEARSVLSFPFAPLI